MRQEDEPEEDEYADVINIEGPLLPLSRVGEYWDEDKIKY